MEPMYQTKDQLCEYYGKRVARNCYILILVRLLVQCRGTGVTWHRNIGQCVSEWRKRNVEERERRLRVDSMLSWQFTEGLKYKTRRNVRITILSRVRILSPYTPTRLLYH